METPMLGRTYQAGTLPPGSVVTGGRDTEYVIGRSGLCMRWEQPIPLSDSWLVTYTGRLAEGEWMTPRERAEVDECRNRRLLSGHTTAGGHHADTAIPGQQVRRQGQLAHAGDPGGHRARRRPAPPPVPCRPGQLRDRRGRSAQQGLRARPPPGVRLLRRQRMRVRRREAAVPEFFVVLCHAKSMAPPSVQGPERKMFRLVSPAPGAGLCANRTARAALNVSHAPGRRFPVGTAAGLLAAWALQGVQTVNRAVSRKKRRVLCRKT